MTGLFLQTGTFVVFLSSALILVNIDLYMNLHHIIISIFSDSFRWNVFDYFFTAIALPLMLVTSLVLRKVELLSQKISLLKMTMLLLFSFLVFAPAFVSSDPDFHYELKAARLLPPLSSKTLLIISDSDNTNSKFRTSLITRDYNYFEIYTGEKIEISGKPAKISSQNGVKFTRFENKYFAVKKAFFLLGTDNFGRDVFSRIVYGTRLSLFIASLVTLFSSFFGIVFGYLAGIFSGFTDRVFDKFADALLCVPLLFLVIFIAAFTGNSLFTIILILSLTGWMSLFKIVRGEVISLKNKNFIITSQMLGIGKLKILKDEILPLIAAPVIVNLVFLFSNVIITESALSYLGFGSGVDYPSWGAMINQGQLYLSNAWWISGFSCLIIFITVITINNAAKKINDLSFKL
ncbi:MAG: ABC transporter permease [Ignavibacteria bacterium]|nr:ABC transporter permease [Ignavibacteria bacterium]